jgi:hypothetical protein
MTTSLMTTSLMITSLMISVLMITLLGCAVTKPHTHSPWDQLEGESYPYALKAWTRSDEVFEDFEGRLFATATWVTPHFERARAQHHGDRLSLTAQEVERLQEALIQKASGSILFFVVVMTQDSTLNDLRPRGAPLSAHLIYEDQVYAPEWITVLTTQEQATMRFDFPHLSLISRGYWVSFPRPASWRKPQKSDDTEARSHRSAGAQAGREHLKRVQFRLSSLPATIKLTWESIL